jgi:putative molybdopterin biosynthesis protein
MKRNVYLKSTDLKDINPIIDLIVKNYKVQYETISVVDSLNRISFEGIYANVSSPYYSASAMDGIALKASLTYEASETNPVVINKKDIIYINTGNEIPEKFDAVVMIEDVYDNNNGTISLIKSVRPYQDIRPIGEDIVEGDMVIPKNHLIRPVDISALLSSGIVEIKVIKKPRVAIIPTGDEIIRDVKDLKKGKIIDSNTFFMKNELTLLGAESKIFDVVVDEFNLLEKAVIEASNNYDLVLIGAGSSAGSKDYAKNIIEKNGIVHVHGISIKPGKPTIIGQIKNTPIIGIPGYPVSTFISFDLVVKPIIRKVLNIEKTHKEVIKAKLTKKIYSSLKNEEFIRVKLGIINNEYIASPLDRGAGVTMSLVKADGIMIVPKNSEGYLSGSIVDVSLLKDIKEIEKSLISIGSHDILLDKVDDLMSNDNYHLSSSHIGSFGGIMAIKSKGCHIAPVHVLDEDGTYNLNLLDKYLDSDYCLVRGVSRVQGLMVKKGNPKNIQSLKDLTKDGITFVNRQRGSGTRILLDYMLAKEKIDSKDVKGYDFELSTHMLVASSVKDSRFDCGMGIVSVANLNNLDIVEVGKENYDFLVLKNIIDTPIYNEFIKALQSVEFKNELDKLGGYIINDIGVIIK